MELLKNVFKTGLLSSVVYATNQDTFLDKKKKASYFNHGPGYQKGPHTAIHFVKQKLVLYLAVHGVYRWNKSLL